MKFGIIGAGALAQAFAAHPLKAGHEVILSNSRSPASLAGLVRKLGAGATAGTVAEAGEADLVVLAVNWERVRDAVQALPPRPGRVLIDATNQWTAPAPEFVDNSVYGSEMISSLAPGTHVIKGFNNMLAGIAGSDPITPAGRRILFFAGDDADVKRRFAAALDEFGFAPIDLGDLKAGRALQVIGPFTGLHAVREGQNAGLRCRKLDTSTDVRAKASWMSSRTAEPTPCSSEPKPCSAERITQTRSQGCWVQARHRGIVGRDGVRVL
jgi:predicted dinucleotide-binding enzyme